VPVLLNIYYPPNARRCGRTLASVINRSRRDLGIAVAAGRGLSHFVVDETLDRKVLDAIKRKDAATLRALSRNELNSGSSEILNWVMTAAMPEHPAKNRSEYYPPTARRRAPEQGSRLRPGTDQAPMYKQRSTATLSTLCPRDDQPNQTGVEQRPLG
jgi:hypothetical protein